VHHSWWRQRVFATTAAVLTLVAGLGCRAVFSGWVSKYGGVALWATLVYFLVLWVRPQLAVARAALLCFSISVAVELFQLTPVPRALYEVHGAFALVFGTTFHAWDLLAYAVGALLGAAIHAAFRAAFRHRSPSRVRSRS
jgi:Protein of unknown function (DUF2809)